MSNSIVSLFVNMMPSACTHLAIRRWKGSFRKVLFIEGSQSKQRTCRSSTTALVRNLRSPTSRRSESTSSHESMASIYHPTTLCESLSLLLKLLRFGLPVSIEDRSEETRDIQATVRLFMPLMEWDCYHSSYYAEARECFTVGAAKSPL